MFSEIGGYELTLIQWLLAIGCGMLIGMAKTGLSGAGILVVPTLAVIFGGRTSVGLLLPILVFADIFAVTYYHRHANWKYVIKPLPWALAGILVAVFVGERISDEQFNKLIGVLVMAGIAMMLWQDLRKSSGKIPDHWWFSALLGLTGGFATMIGNAAGPILALYMLSMRLPKNNYIGTTAWFFFIINLLKVPLHIFAWQTITLKSFAFDLLMIPPILAGAFLGVFAVKLMPEKFYRIFIIASTAISALLLI